MLLKLEEILKFSMTMSIAIIYYEGTIHPDIDLMKVSKVMRDISWEERNV